MISHFPDEEKIQSRHAIGADLPWDIKTSIWRSKIIICSALKRFFGITRLLSKSVSLKPLGTKRPGQVNLKTDRSFLYNLKRLRECCFHEHDRPVLHRCLVFRARNRGVSDRLVRKPGYPCLVLQEPVRLGNEMGRERPAGMSGLRRGQAPMDREGVPEQDVPLRQGWCPAFEIARG